MRCINAAVALLVSASHLLGAQRTVERATAGPDTNQHFAIYYPSTYTESRRWPVIFVMDPRGRATAGIELFSHAAEQLGYVVMSSYGSRSDVDAEPNIDAMNAMLAGAQSMIATDFSRLYTAGMSGTARAAWALGREMPEHFAGILAASAAPLLLDSSSMAVLKSPGFAFAMTAGSTDFNLSEVRGSDRMLRSRRIPAAVDYFDGGHGWPPVALIDRAVAWFSLRAMLGGKIPRDTGFVNAQFTRDTMRAAALERAGQWLASADDWQAIAVAYENAYGATVAARRAQELNGRKGVDAMRKRLTALDDRYARGNAALVGELGAVRAAARLPSPAEIARALDIEELRRTAASGDSLERPWALRMLVNAQTFLGNTEPRAYLARGDARRALLMLQTFRLIAPFAAPQCGLIAQAASMLSDAARAGAPACAPVQPPPTRKT